jgi:hypothetical protein
MNIKSRDWDGRVCTLVHAETKEPIPMGSLVKLSGETVRATGGRAPHHSNSTGRVWVADVVSGHEAEYFPGVIDAQWVPEGGAK